jgi:hypothetical protein
MLHVQNRPTTAPPLLIAFSVDLLLSELALLWSRIELRKGLDFRCSDSMCKELEVVTLSKQQVKLRNQQQFLDCSENWGQGMDQPLLPKLNRHKVYMESGNLFKNKRLKNWKLHRNLC